MDQWHVYFPVNTNICKDHPEDTEWSCTTTPQTENKQLKFSQDTAVVCLLIKLQIFSTVNAVPASVRFENNLSFVNLQSHAYEYSTSAT